MQVEDRRVGVLAALGSSGTVLWANTINTALSMPDGNGGLLALTDSYPPVLTDYDGVTGQALWSQQQGYSGFLLSLNSAYAIGLDGKVWSTQSSTQGEAQLVALDANTGNQVFSYSVPASGTTWIDCTGRTGWWPNWPFGTSIGPPSVGPDGTVYALMAVHNDIDVGDGGGLCATVYKPNITLQLLQVSPGGGVSQMTINTITANLPNGHIPLPVPGEIIPDGSGGTLAAWVMEDGNVNEFWQQHVIHNASDTILPSLQEYNYADMVLGENNTVFATDGLNIAAFTIDGPVQWTWSAPSGSTASIVAAASGGGLVAKSSAPDPANHGMNDIDTIVRFDSSGNGVSDPSTGNSLNYLDNGTWIGPLPSGVLYAFANPPVSITATLPSESHGFKKSGGTGCGATNVIDFINAHMTDVTTVAPTLFTNPAPTSTVPWAQQLSYMEQNILGLSAKETGWGTNTFVKGNGYFSFEEKINGAVYENGPKKPCTSPTNPQPPSTTNWWGQTGWMQAGQDPCVFMATYPSFLVSAQSFAASNIGIAARNSFDQTAFTNIVWSLYHASNPKDKQALFGTITSVKQRWGCPKVNH